jgi:RNA polymerase sigma factor (sigma-70 family)
LQDLLAIAGRRLKSSAKLAVTADDIASIAFNEFLTGAQEGRFPTLANRDDLWQVLMLLVRRRSIDQLRAANSRKRVGASKMGKPIVDTISLDDNNGLLPSDSPTPSEAILLQEEFETRLGELQEERLKQIALYKMSGYTNSEIATKLECSERSVERKLVIIRRRWSVEHTG